MASGKETNRGTLSYISSVKFLHESRWSSETIAELKWISGILEALPKRSISTRTKHNKVSSLPFSILFDNIATLDIFSCVCLYNLRF